MFRVFRRKTSFADFSTPGRLQKFQKYKISISFTIYRYTLKINQPEGFDLNLDFNRIFTVDLNQLI